MSNASQSKKAVIYARFSCSKQREASIEDQLRVCTEWCEREGYEVVACYKDEAKSGRTDDRPAFQRMIANAGESDIVLVYMMDRFSRDIYDAPIYKKQLRDKGVRVVSATETLPDGPEAMLMENMYEAFAAMESAKIGMRTRRGMEGNALKCMHNGVRVFGYRFAEDGTYEVEEIDAAFVREGFRRHNCYESTNSIARDFARRGVKTLRGKPCSYTMVNMMLHNEKYTGVYKFGNVRIEGGMPAIIDKETFMKAQQIRGRKNRKKENWGEYALSRKALCAECAHDLRGISGYGASGKRYDYYGCKDKHIRNVSKEWLEGEIASEIRNMLRDDDNVTRIADMVERAIDPEAKKKEARKALIEADSGLDNILYSIEKGIIPPKANERIAQLEEQKALALEKLDKLEFAFDRVKFSDFLRFGATLTDEKLLRVFVYQVLVSDDKVLVTLNYDAKADEPARFVIERVRQIDVWQPIANTKRTSFAIIDALLVFKIARAA